MMKEINFINHITFILKILKSIQVVQCHKFLRKNKHSLKRYIKNLQDVYAFHEKGDSKHLDWF